MKFSILFRFLLFAGVLFTVASCSDDEVDLPIIELVDEAGFVSGSAALVTPGDPVLAKVRGIKGSNNLNTLTIFRDDVALPLEDITYNGTPASANPRLLLGGEEEGFTFEVEIVAHDMGRATYTFEVADEEGNSDAISIDIVVGEGLTVIRGGDDVVDTDFGAYTSVPLDVMVGLAPLLELSVTTDGTPIDAARLRFLSDDAAAQFDANPYLIPEASAEGFSGNLYIQAQNTSGEVEYVITVSDTDGNVASATVILKTGTPIDGEYVAIVLNNADGPNQGGIDLRNNTNESVTVSSLSADADIVDKGIDISHIPVEDNWYQQILPANGAQLRVPDFTVMENFSYETTDTKEAIIEAFNSGISKTESDVVEVGDLFLVKKNDDYFLMQCTLIEVTNTTVNNQDKYEFSIKQALSN